jgi:hypothetical protein
MSSDIKKKLEDYARSCSELARRAETPNAARGYSKWRENICMPSQGTMPKRKSKLSQRLERGGPRHPP